MASAWKTFPLLLALLVQLASASVTSLKDVAALDSFLGKQDVALIEFYSEKEGKAMPSDLEEASKLLDLGDVAATARVAGVEAVTTKFELQESSLPIIHLFVKGKPYGDDFEGDRNTEATAGEIAAFARQKVKEAREEGVLKEKGEVEELKSSRADRLCFKAEGVCVIYLANGKASSEEVGLLTKLKKKNTSKLSAGANARGTQLWDQALMPEMLLYVAAKWSPEDGAAGLAGTSTGDLVRAHMLHWKKPVVWADSATSGMLLDPDVCAEALVAGSTARSRITEDDRQFFKGRWEAARDLNKAAEENRVAAWAASEEVSFRWLYQNSSGYLHLTFLSYQTRGICDESGGILGINGKGDCVRTEAAAGPLLV